MREAERASGQYIPAKALPNAASALILGTLLPAVLLVEKDVGVRLTGTDTQVLQNQGQNASI